MTKPIQQIRKEFLITLASSMLGMRDVDIAEIFGMTKQGVSKILKKK